MPISYEEEVPGTTEFWLIIFGLTAMVPLSIFLGLEAMGIDGRGVACLSWFFVFVLSVPLILMNDKLWDRWYKFYNREEGE